MNRNVEERGNSRSLKLHYQLLIYAIAFAGVLLPLWLWYNLVHVVAHLFGVDMNESGDQPSGKLYFACIVFLLVAFIIIGSVIARSIFISLYALIHGCSRENAKAVIKDSSFPDHWFKPI